MTTIRGDEVRIPRRARAAVARHEAVTVTNHDRPVFVIVHPDDQARGPGAPRHGRPLQEALAMLMGSAPPDPGFGDDLEAVLGLVGQDPRDPWTP